MSTIPVILTIAGSDCSGGAGIQADIKTISALKGYAASVITAVTAQNTMGVQAVCPIPPDIVRAQITSVMDDLQPAAIKIGMVHNAAIVHTIAECLQNIRSRRYRTHHSRGAVSSLFPDNPQFGRSVPAPFKSRYGYRGDETGRL